VERIVDDDLEARSPSVRLPDAIRPGAAVAAFAALRSTEAAVPWIYVAIAIAVEAAVFLYIADVGIAVASALGVATMAACALSRPRFAIAVVAIVVVSLLVVLVTARGGGARIGVTGLAAGAIALLAAMGSALAALANRTLDRLNQSYVDALAGQREAVAGYQTARARVIELGATVDNVYWETDAAMRLRFLSRGFAKAGGKVPRMRMLLGYDPIDVAERLLGRYGRMPALLARMRNQEAISGMRMAWRDEAGNLRTSSIYGYPQFDPEGRLVRYRGVVVHTAQFEVGTPAALPTRTARA
jgi:hypothetical protein